MLKWGQPGAKWGQPGVKWGGVRLPQEMAAWFDPDNWLISAHEMIERYARLYFPADNYDVLFSYPGASVVQRGVPLAKTVIHFDQDDAGHAPLGFGLNVIGQTYDEGTGTVVEKAGQWHTLNFDVGVWTSQQRGADLERLRVHQKLVSIFGHNAKQQFFDYTKGMQIVSFNGGRYLIEEINAVPTWRVSGIELVVRCIGRDTMLPVPFTYPDSDGPSPGVVITGELTIATEE